ncbi:MAG: cytosine deaminase [Nitrososphaerales archaeon]|jgi:cytosine deaminase
MQLVVRNARLRGRSGTYDLAVDGGAVRRISRSVGERGEEEIDAAGNLVVPPFVDMHFHLDSALAYGDPRFNESGTLLEGIEIWGEKKRKISQEEIHERGSRMLKLMLVSGTQVLRTNADVTEPRQAPLRALLGLRDEFRELMDIQVTAFPQDGIMTDPQNGELLERSVELGADNVGMIPHHEFTREDGVRSIEFAFDLAQKYDRDVDGHVDETDDDQSRFLEVVAAQSIRRHYEGRVTAGHATAMGSYNDAYAEKLYRLLRRAGVTVVINPLINITIQGRSDSYPKRRGMARLKELVERGVNVALGHDCAMDPWYPLGKGDMVQALFMAVHVGQLTGRKELVGSLDLITTNPARALRMGRRYGIEVGRPANLVVLEARSEVQALARLSPPLYVVRGGRTIVRRTPSVTELVGPGGAETLDVADLLRTG